MESKIESNDSNDYSPCGSKIFMTDSDGGLKVLPEYHRIALLTLYSFLGTIAIVGNSAAVLVIFFRKAHHRHLYKSYVISLAVNDLLLALSCSAVNIPKFLKKWTNTWVLGKFWCSLMPMINAACLLTNSITLSCIAIDRYRAISAHKTWNPRPAVCMAINLCIWISSTGVAVPMFNAYTYLGPVNVWHKENGTAVAHEGCVYFCVVEDKMFKNQYFTATFCIIFLPLLLTFSGSYMIVAHHVWARRKPPTSDPNILSRKEMTLSNRNAAKATSTATESGACGSTKCHYASEKLNIQCANSVGASYKSSSILKHKLRTFKIILIIVLSSVVGHLPSWVFNVAKSLTNANYDNNVYWLMQFWFSVLSVASAAFNPFLYCFLSQSLNLCQVIRALSVKLFTSKAKAAPVSTIPRQPVFCMEPRGPYC